MDLETISFQIISTVGTARSLYIEAIEQAKKGDYEAARQCIADGKEVFLQGHETHLQVLAKFAEGEKMDFNILLMHAEDQMMAAESFCVLAEQFIDLYKRLDGAK